MVTPVISPMASRTAPRWWPSTTPRSGPNWANNTNWLSDRPLGEWHGVTTDANGRVTRLILGGNQLSGEIPSSLGSLANLQELHLGGNKLSGADSPGNWAASSTCNRWT